MTWFLILLLVKKKSNTFLFLEEWHFKKVKMLQITLSLKVY